MLDKENLNQLIYALMKQHLMMQVLEELVLTGECMEMKDEDVKAWQIYFADNGLKQPFEQIWTPVVDAESIKSDRYA